MEHATRLALRLAMSLTLVAAFSSSASAQSPGRLSLTAVDPEGNPVEGVKIVMTTAERNDLRYERVTNGKGRAQIAVPNATLLYDTTIEKEGFAPITTQIRVGIGGTTRREIVLTPQDGSGAEVQTGDGELVFTPAEEAFNEGVRAMQAQDLDTAEAKFLEARDLDDSMAVVHAALAAVYSQKGEYDKSVAAAERVLEMEPANSRALRLLYEGHTKLGNEREAKRALSALTDLGGDRDAAPVLFNEGAEAVRAGDLNGAESRFREALELDPELTAALDGMILVLARREQWQEALPFAERLLALEPTHRRGLQVRYDALAALGDPRAEDALRALARLDPSTMKTVFLDAGKSLFDAGDITGAIAELEKVVAIDPDDADAHYLLGLCHVNGGNRDKARTHLKRFIELAPDSANAPTAREMLQYLE